MLINENDAASRLNSPMNLMNRLRRESNSSRAAKASMSLFQPNSSTPDSTEPFNPFKPRPSESSAITGVVVDDTDASGTKLDSILDNADNRIKQELIHNAAQTALVETLNRLNNRIPEINKAKDLADVAMKMSKIVDDIRKDRKGVDGADKTVHIHFYAPTQKKLTEYESVDV